MAFTNPPTGAAIKMTGVDEQQIESIGYSGRTLYIKLKGSGETITFDGVPRFRYEGLMNAPRKDAYYLTYIKNSFLAKHAAPPTPG